MADDFEKAVLITFNYGGNIDPSLKVSFCSQVVAVQEQCAAQANFHAAAAAVTSLHACRSWCLPPVATASRLFTFSNS
jgi:hypothetical protein